jgi:hypothetical protein
MAHFYGVLQGSRGAATRCGTKGSGMVTTCASWTGAIKCRAYQKHRGGLGPLEDWVEVCMVPWHGAGTTATIYDGPIGEFANGGQTVREAAGGAPCYLCGKPQDYSGDAHMVFQFLVCGPCETAHEVEELAEALGIGEGSGIDIEALYEELGLVYEEEVTP